MNQGGNSYKIIFINFQKDIIVIHIHVLVDTGTCSVLQMLRLTSGNNSNQSFICLLVSGDVLNKSMKSDLKLPDKLTSTHSLIQCTPVFDCFITMHAINLVIYLVGMRCNIQWRVSEYPFYFVFCTFFNNIVTEGSLQSGLC